MPFFTPGGYQRSIDKGIPGISGSIILPSMKPAGFLTDHEDLSSVEYYDRRLLDPQIYLANLDESQCQKRCAYLASYPWFDIGALQRKKSGGVKATQRWHTKAKKTIAGNWGTTPTGKGVELAVRETLRFQSEIGCEALILPAPLTIDRASTLDDERFWLDTGLAIGRLEYDLPLIASVALSDHALVGVNAKDNALLNLILDQVSAREPDGVYIVIELASGSYYPTATTTVGSIMRLVGGFKAAGVNRVIINYATVAGLIMYAIGADDWCTGWYLSERRLDLAAMKEKEDEVKSAYPAYYSHRLAGEIHLKVDLDRLIDEGLIDELQEDTIYSSGLFEALRSGQSVADVAEWQFRQGKVRFARSHFSSVMARETATIDGLGPKARLSYVESWLKGASKLAQKLNGMEDLHARTSIAHQRNWLRAFSAYADDL